MSAAILTIGDEILRGDINNTNCTWLCDKIASLGVAVGECVVVADDVDAIAECLVRLSAKHSVIVTTGGLGPTTDDLTAAAATRALGVTLKRDPESVARIEARLAASGRACSESNRKQADLPEGARVLNNDWGTAPGFSARLGSATVFFFPGVPREMKPMFERDVPRVLRENESVHTAHARLKLFGAGESAIGDLLDGVEQEYGVKIGYRAHFPEVEVRAVAEHTDPAEARRLAETAADAMAARLGKLVYERGPRTLPQVVGDVLRKRQLTLGLAESCTGGLASELIARYPASDFFRGAVVCYDNAIKENVLGVDRRVLEVEGAVSEVVVKQLAEGARRVLGADVGLAFSGIAGPTGGTPSKPVGLVHYAISTPDALVARQEVFRGDRNQVQLRAAFAGLDLVRTLLSGV